MSGRIVDAGDRRQPVRLGENEIIHAADSTIDVESGGPGAIYGLVGPTGTPAFETTYVVSGVVDSTTESL